MVFSRMELHAIVRALLLAERIVQRKIKAAKRRDDQKRVKPGLIAGLAMEGGDYRMILEKIKKSGEVD